MLILRTAGGLRIVRQPEHAGLSARIAVAWSRPENLPAGFWPRFLEAVRRHDDGWIREEERPALDAGGEPYDFKGLPAREHFEVWRRSVALARAADPYAALIIAQHGRWLSEEFGGSGGEREQARAFQEEMDRSMAADREALARAGGDERAAVKPQSLLLARRLLSFFDGLSLRLLGAIRLDRSEPLAFGSREEEIAVEARGEPLTLRPWPFLRPALKVEVEARWVDRTIFGSPHELAAELAAAASRTLSFDLVSGGEEPPRE